MDQQPFESQPMKKPSLSKMLAFGAILFIGLASVVAAVVIPGMKTTDDRSKAANLVSCAGNIAAPAAACGEKCLSTDDCGSGLRCMAWGVSSGMTCRNAINPGSATCSGATTVPTTAPTKPPATTLPSAPPGCVYKQVQCIQAPCDPILVCSSPTPTPTPPTGCVYKPVECFQAPCNPILVCDGPAITHTIRLVNRPVGTSTIYMDFDGIIENGKTVQETSSRFTYSGAWIAASLSTVSGGTTKYTGTTGGYVQFTSTATDIVFIGAKQSNLGAVDVYVDGVAKGSIDQTGPGSIKQYQYPLSKYLR